MNFCYPVYNPNFDCLDAAGDWGVFPQHTKDYELVMQQPFRVATVAAFYTEPGIYSYNPNIPKVDLSKFDLVLISDAEYYSQRQIVEWAKQQGISNYLIAVGGLMEYDQLDPETTLYRPYWLSTFFKENPEQVNTYSTDKPFLFDTMLGARRPHRDYVMLSLTKSQLLDRCIATYRDCFPGNLIDEKTQKIHTQFAGTNLNWPYVSPNLDPAWEVRSTIDNTISFISPVEIYRQTHYSIVCETNFTGRGFFFSEKMMKAIFNRRVFVLFANCGYLKHLKSFGFKTFDYILDESYDLVAYDINRYREAMLQVMRLAWLESPQWIYERLKHTLDFNYNRLLAWRPEYKRTMHDMVRKKIPSDHWR